MLSLPWTAKNGNRYFTGVNLKTISRDSRLEIMNEFGYRRVRKRMGGTRVYSWEKNTEVINMESPQEA